ncbi:hypothetical protein VTL71DRAFT_5826, partial [Oculimacula yallundae]
MQEQLYPAFAIGPDVYSKTVDIFIGCLRAGSKPEFMDIELFSGSWISFVARRELAAASTRAYLGVVASLGALQLVISFLLDDTL